MSIEQEMIVEILKEEGQMTQEQLSTELFVRKQMWLAPRTIREHIKAINEKYISGENDYIISSNCNGIFISRNIDEIKRYNKAKKKLALSLLRSSYQCDKRADESKNLSFEDYLKETAQMS